MKKRMLKINDEIARTAAQIIRQEMSDPRLGSVVSVVRAETAADLSVCKIFVSVIGDESERAKTMEALTNASGFMRKRMADTVNLRQTPEVKFLYDDSIEHGIKMRRLIEEVGKQGGTEHEGDS